MALNIVYILLGIAAVLWGADKFTDGAAELARRFRIPEIIIGLTVVAMGTSAPELSASLVSALKHADGMAIGNVVGSNIFNALLIVGVSAIVAPIVVLPGTVRRDIPVGLAASVALALILMLTGGVSRLAAAALLLGFAAFLAYTIAAARRNSSATASAADTATPQPGHALWKSLLFIIFGLACLVVGSSIFVDGAKYVASALHISDAVIGLTVVACGTSLPELATSVVSARKGQSGIAIGNVIGSNIFNVLLILGLTGLISPMGTLGGLTVADVVVFLGSMLLLWGASYTKYKIERWEGWVFSLVFAAYMAWLVASAVG